MIEWLVLNDAPKSQDYYLTSLEPINPKTKQKYPYAWVSKYFTNKKDALKFVKDNANSNDTFTINFYSGHRNRPCYRQNGKVDFSTGYGGNGKPDVYLSTHQEIWRY